VRTQAQLCEVYQDEQANETCQKCSGEGVHVPRVGKSFSDGLSDGVD
jgi:hypothetical protein